MRTTLDIPDPLFRQVKACAARQGLKLKELLTAYIEAGLRGSVAPVSAARGGQQGVPPIPIARFRDGAVTPARSNRELRALLEEEDIAQYRRILNGNQDVT